MSPGEDFKSVLRSDWKIVTTLSATHGELAAHVRCIIEFAEAAKISYEGQIEYDATKCHNRMSSRQQKPQPLKITKTFYMGDQFSLFYNFEKDRKGEQPKENQKWNVEYRIENLNNGVWILIGGTSTSGVITYIEEYGFYEGGGVNNEYRVDPFSLYAVITGECRPEVLGIYEEKARVKETQLLQEMNRDEKRQQELRDVLLGKKEDDNDNNKKKSIEEEEMEWLGFQLTKWQSELAAHREATASILAKIAMHSPQL